MTAELLVVIMLFSDNDGSVVMVVDCLLGKNLRRPFAVSCIQGACIPEVKVKVLFVLGKALLSRNC